MTSDTLIIPVLNQSLLWWSFWMKKKIRNYPVCVLGNNVQLSVQTFPLYWIESIPHLKLRWSQPPFTSDSLTFRTHANYSHLIAIHLAAEWQIFLIRRYILDVYCCFKKIWDVYTLGHEKLWTGKVESENNTRKRDAWATGCREKVSLNQ